MVCVNDDSFWLPLWPCFDGGGLIDSWEAMIAFSAYPTPKRTRSIKRGVERGAEFCLDRELSWKELLYRFVDVNPTVHISFA